MSNLAPRIAITAGEPAGIGPDLCIMLAQHRLEAKVVVIADADMLSARATQLNLAINIIPYIANNISLHHGGGSLTVLHQPIGPPAIACRYFKF